jgi:hypothetical protein
MMKQKKRFSEQLAMISQKQQINRFALECDMVSVLRVLLEVNHCI